MTAEYFLSTVRQTMSWELSQRECRAMLGIGDFTPHSLYLWTSL